MTSKIVGNVHSIDGLNAVEVDAIDKADVTVGALDEEVIKDMQLQGSCYRRKSRCISNGKTDGNGKEVRINYFSSHYRSEGNTTFKGKFSNGDVDVLVDQIDLPNEVEVEDKQEADGALVSVQRAGRMEADGRRSRMVKETKNGMKLYSQLYNCQYDYVAKFHVSVIYQIELGE